MSKRRNHPSKSRQAHRQPRPPRLKCDRCNAPNPDHLLVLGTPDGLAGLELHSCKECWPALQMAVRSLGHAA